MKWLRGAIAAAVLAMVAMPAVGQNNGNNVRFAGVTNAKTSELTHNGYRYYVGPYSLQLLHAPGSPLIDAYCVDFLNAVTWNQQWTANFSVLSNQNHVVARTRAGLRGLNVFEAQQRYAAAAWLTRRFTDGYDWGNVHAAMWHLLTPNSPTWGDPENVLFYEALANWQSVNMDNWVVVTDVRAMGDGNAMYGGTQEFLVNVNVVPEPATLILMGTGLVAVMGLTVVMRRSVG